MIQTPKSGEAAETFPGTSRAFAPGTEPTEALFPEAKQRERRRRLRWLGGGVVSLAVIGLAVAVVVGAFAGSTQSRSTGSSGAPLSSVRVLACSGKTVSRPSTFMISCADGNAALTATNWTTWTASHATGTTKLALNLCNPYCAASKISYFPGSSVRLSAPVATRRGELFSKLVVTYRLDGKTRSFPFTWIGEPSFKR